MQTKDDLIRVYTHVKTGIAVRECLLLREKLFKLRNRLDEKDVRPLFSSKFEKCYYDFSS